VRAFAGSFIVAVLMLLACGPERGSRAEGRPAEPIADPPAAPLSEPAPSPTPFAAPPATDARASLPAPIPPALTRERTLLEEARSDFSHVQIQQLGRRRSMIFRREDGSELTQTTIEVNHADSLALPYAKAQAAALLLVPHPRRVLVLGLGGGTLPRFFRRMIPDVTIDAVEIDPVVVELAARWFGIEAGPRMEVFTEDAIAFIDRSSPTSRRAHDRSYDLIYVDAFLEPNAEGADNSGIPLALRKQTILEGLRSRLAPAGAAVFNLHFRSGYAEQAAAIAAVFPRRYKVGIDSSTQRHIIALAGDPPALDAAQLASRAAVLDADGRFGVDFGALVGKVESLE